MPIEGVCTPRLRVEGGRTLSGAEHTLGGDYIEAGTWAVLGAVTGGAVEIDGASAEDLEPIDLTSAQTGNTSRDKTMHQDVLETPKYPLAVFHAEKLTGTVPASGSGQVTLEGTLSFHGADHKVKLPAKLDGWESHCDEVKNLPNDFVRTATNEVSEIQAMQHTALPLFGVQFHPELFDDEHGHGRTILENFLKL